MWMWVGVLVFVALVLVAAKMLDRRGSTGASRAEDLPGVEHPRLDRSQGSPTYGGGGDGGDGGGGGW